MKAIVVGIDGSSSALDATRWAARDAARRKTGLRLVHACHLPATNPRSPISLPTGYADALVEYGDNWLQDARSAATEVVPGLAVDTVTSTGNPVVELLSASESAQLVVLGSRGLGGFSSLLVGSVAVAVAARAHCPVIVVRGDADSPARDTAPVVVGVDRSEAGGDAIGFAFEAAELRGVPLIAVNAWTYATIETAWPEVPLKVSEADIEAGQRRVLAERLADWQQKYPEVVTEQRVVRGRPARTLLAQAADAQVIVVGTHGKTALIGLGLGSVSQAALHHARCAVAVVGPTSR
ncbi:MAG: universal stress protein [Actinophytocola sp.]|nr:universal stress protein [Actinophytocola sp.]